MVYITAICLFFAVAITIAVIFFFFKYRRKDPAEVGVPIHGDMRLEIAWIAGDRRHDGARAAKVGVPCQRAVRQCARSFP